MAEFWASKTWHLKLLQHGISCQEQNTMTWSLDYHSWVGIRTLLMRTILFLFLPRGKRLQICCVGFEIQIWLELCETLSGWQPQTYVSCRVKILACQSDKHLVCVWSFLFYKFLHRGNSNKQDRKYKEDWNTPWIWQR